jgi:hypothetical protein
MTSLALREARTYALAANVDQLPTVSGLDAEANTWPVVRLYQSVGQYLRLIDFTSGLVA